MNIGVHIWCYRYDKNYNLQEIEAVIKGGEARSRKSEFLLCMTVKDNRLIKPGRIEGDWCMRCMWLSEPNMAKAQLCLEEHLTIEMIKKRAELDKIQKVLNDLSRQDTITKLGVMLNEQTIKDIDRAFKALEERDELLDQIKAEINSLPEYYYITQDTSLISKNAVNRILDKYKSESEGKE